MMRRSIVPLVLLALAGCQPGDLERAELRERMANGWIEEEGNSVFGRYDQRIYSMDDGSSRITHHIRTDVGFVDLNVPEGFVAPAYGTFVRAWGQGDRYDFDVDEFDIVAEPLIDPDPYPHRRIATVITYWDGTMGIDNANAKGEMFIDSDSTNVFYGENSYGREKIAGDVFGPYMIEDPGACNPSIIADRGLQAFVDHMHDPDDYRQFMWWFPGLGDCGFGGLASIGSVEDPARDSWYNGNFGCVVRNQEIGHNYGMGHSHDYDGCTDGMGNPTPFGDDCVHDEYGDPYDPMGGGCAHMNVVQKSYMGWLQDCNIVETTASGTFTLLPTELPCNGTQALRFRAYDDRYYYLEYRQSLGVDAGLDGVLVHVAGGFEYSPSPYILHVGTADILSAGDSYTDPQGIVTMTVVEEDGTRAIIDVQFADGGSGTPTCYGGADPGMVDGHWGGNLECSDEPFPLDTELPTVVITYPPDEMWFEPGSDFTITAEAMDDRGITEAELYYNGEAVFKLFDPPFEWAIDNIPEGDYNFGVIVRDGPNEGLSMSVDVHVGTMPPSDTSGSGGTDEGTTTAPLDTSSGPEGTSDASESTGPNEDTPTDPKGCAGCNTTDRSGGALALFGLAIGIATRRRRRG
jgi:Big-like domain-containing protein